MGARISMSAAPDTMAEGPSTSGHGQRMDGIYAAQRHIYDLTRKYYLLGRDRLIAELNVPDGGHALEVGCGTARNMALAARRYPKAQFYGLDISSEMLKSAEKNLRGLSDRCTLAEADATDFNAQALFGRAEFDRVFCSYTLSMIPGWEKALDIACALLAPGGEVHVVDFGEQEQLPGWFAALLKAWLAKFHVEPRSSLFAEAQALGERHGLTVECRSLFRDYARSVVLRRA